MKFIITGSNGYIATQVAKYLSEEHDLIAMIRKGSFNKNPSLYTKTIYTDGSLDTINKEIATIDGVDAVIHLAAYYSTKVDTETTSKLLVDNVLFTSQILSACAHAGIAFLGTSTFSMLDGDNNFNPRSFYDWTKFSMEELAKTYSVKAGILYLSDTYGPNDSRPKIHNLIHNGVIKQLNSPRDQKINLTTKDVARAIDFTLKDLNKIKDNGVYKYEIYYPETEITLENLADFLDADVDYLGVTEKYSIPKLRFPIPNYKPIFSPKDIQFVLDGD